MSWLSDFFKKDVVRAILNIGLKILKLILGNVAGNLSKIAQEAVANAETLGKSGEEKYEAAFAEIKKRLPEVRDSAINLSIEIAINALKGAQE